MVLSRKIVQITDEDVPKKILDLLHRFNIRDIFQFIDFVENESEVVKRLLGVDNHTLNIFVTKIKRNHNLRNTAKIKDNESFPMGYFMSNEDISEYESRLKKLCKKYAESK